MTRWYLSFDDQQVGPLDEAQAAAQARQHPEGYAWRGGFTAWVPVAEIKKPRLSITGFVRGRFFKNEVTAG